MVPRSAFQESICFLVAEDVEIFVIFRGICLWSGVISSYLSANCCELESFAFMHIAKSSIDSRLSEVFL